MEKRIGQTEEIYIYNNEGINDIKEDATGEKDLSAVKVADPLPSPSSKNGDRP